MSYRTDVKLSDDGRIVSNVSSMADQRQALPELVAPGILASDKHAEAWLAEAGTLDAGVAGFAGVQQQAARTFAALTDMREHQSPHVRQAEHLETLARTYDSHVKKLADQLDRAREAATKRATQIDLEFRSSVKWNAQDASEIRQVLRASEPERRAEIIADAIARGDGQILAATLGAHPVLSGLSGDHQKAYRERALRQHRPDLARIEATTEKASRGALDAFSSFLEAGDALTAKQVRERYATQRKQALDAAERLKAASPTF